MKFTQKNKLHLLCSKNKTDYSNLFLILQNKDEKLINPLHHVTFLL